MLVLAEHRQRPALAASRPATAQGSARDIGVMSGWAQPSRSRPGDRRHRRGKSLRLCICSHQAPMRERTQQRVTCGPSRADLSLDFEHAHGGFDVMTSPLKRGEATIIRMRGLGEDEVAHGLRNHHQEACGVSGGDRMARPHHMRRPAGRRHITRCIWRREVPGDGEAVHPLPGTAAGPRRVGAVTVSHPRPWHCPHLRLPHLSPPRAAPPPNPPRSPSLARANMQHRRES